jgi:hypothetical protein
MLVPMSTPCEKHSRFDLSCRVFYRVLKCTYSLSRILLGKLTAGCSCNVDRRAEWMR